MEFSRPTPLLILPLFMILNGCGGGGTDGTTGGSGTSAAKNAYEGVTTQATLTITNRDRFLQLAFGNQGIQPLPQALGFEADLEDVRNRIATGGSTDYQELIACLPGTQQVNATSNSNFSFFTISIEYTDCDGTSVDLDGTLRGTFSYNGDILAGADKTREDLTYRNLDILTGGDELRLRGEEEVSYNIAGNSSELEKEVTITDQDTDRQTYYADVEIELDNDNNQWHLAAIESLSGKVHDSVDGFVSLGRENSNLSSGPALVLQGAAGTRVVVEYRSAGNDVLISFHDGSGEAPSTQTLSNNNFRLLLNP